MADKVKGLSNWFGSVFIGKILTPVGVVLFLGGTTLAMIEVFRRYVLGRSWMWQQDLVVILVLCGVCLFFTIAQWDRAHISVTALAEFLARKPTPKRMRAVGILHGVADAWTGVFISLIFFWGWPLIWEYQHRGIRTQSQLMPFWPFFLIVILALIPLTFSFFLHAYQSFRKQELGGPGPEEKK